MLAEKVKTMGATEDKPRWSVDGKTIHWKGQIFPMVTFYMIHATTLSLMEILDVAERKSREEKDNFFHHLIDKYLSLSRLLQSLPAVQAWSESFYASLAIQRYWWEEDARSRLEAKERLEKVRKVIYLDELFMRPRVHAREKPNGGRIVSSEERVLLEIIELAEMLR